MDQQDQHQLLRLQRIEVDGLFGIYDHRIDLNLYDRVTLLHGQNGVGKTTVLRMINALLSNDSTYFSRIPFTRFLLVFQDGSNLELTKSSGSNRESNVGVLTLQRKVGGRESGETKLQSDVEFLATQTDHPESPGSGGAPSELELLLKFFVGNGRQKHEHSHQWSIPWLDDFLQNANMYLIEAQRLVRMRFDPTSSSALDSRAHLWPFLHSPPVSSVVECSQDFKKRLDDTMAAYGRQAQMLDQTFPQRLISATDELDVQQIQTRVKELDERTENYKKIEILDTTAAHPFDFDSLGDLDHTQARVMTLYIQDTEHKLGVLHSLASRTRLLLENINGKFNHKKIRLDREEGLVAKNESDQKLPLRSLSSGEQHELVLHYDLLFKTPPNTIVLIDEPELSLHVEWQKKFLPDLMDIVRLSGFDAVVATHSPFIVGERDDLMVGLGDPI